MMISRRFLASVLLALCTAVPAKAEVILNWINWVAPASYPDSATLSGTTYSYATGTTGSILLPDTTTANVTFSGEIIDPSQSAQSSGFGVASNTYWSLKNYSGTTFVSENVPALPSNGDRVAVAGAGNPNQVLSFSKPVSNIVMDIWSLGNPNDLGSWRFSQPFVILSRNAGQYPSAPYSLQADSGNLLNGYEGAGTVQFLGTFSSLSWEVLDPEIFSVWNIGVTSASVVPEPCASAMALAGLACGGYSMWRQRKRATAGRAQSRRYETNQ